jgi:hypothetical protein
LRRAGQPMSYNRHNRPQSLKVVQHHIVRRRNGGCFDLAFPVAWAVRIKGSRQRRR